MHTLGNKLDNRKCFLREPECQPWHFLKLISQFLFFTEDHFTTSKHIYDNIQQIFLHFILNFLLVFLKK